MLVPTILFNLVCNPTVEIFSKYLFQYHWNTADIDLAIDIDICLQLSVFRDSYIVHYLSGFLLLSKFCVCRQPTAEQMRIAQMTSGCDEDPDIKKKINQVCANAFESYYCMWI